MAMLFGKPLPNIWVTTSRTWKPESSRAVAVQCDVRGIAQMKPCAPGFKTRKHSAKISVIDEIHCCLPPLLESHDRPLRPMPAGGSVKRESTEIGGSDLSTSRESPLRMVKFTSYP